MGRCGVDDAARHLFAGLAARAPVFGRVVAHGEVALEVHLDHGVPLLLGDVEAHRVAQEARVVHDDVELPVLGNGLFDERVRAFVDEEVSIGDYVLSGGELPAMVVLDAIARRLPGALGSEESGLVEGFSAELDGGLEYPHYTRLSEFRGWRVPDVLLSGDHGRIDEWRKEQSRLRSAS